jgi:hypothetical protein
MHEFNHYRINRVKLNTENMNREDGVPQGMPWKPLIHTLKEQSKAFSKDMSRLAFFCPCSL